MFSSYPEYVALRDGTLPQMDTVQELLAGRRYQEFMEVGDVAREAGLQPLLLDE